MKTVVFSPAALARLADISAYSADRFGGTQAEAYAARLGAPGGVSARAIIRRR